MNISDTVVTRCDLEIHLRCRIIVREQDMCVNEAYDFDKKYSKTATSYKYLWREMQTTDLNSMVKKEYMKIMY